MIILGAVHNLESFSSFYLIIVLYIVNNLTLSLNKNINAVAKDTFIQTSRVFIITPTNWALITNPTFQYLQTRSLLIILK